MRTIVTAALLAAALQGITINGPSGIGNTSASIAIPNNLFTTVPVGGNYVDAQTQLYDQSFEYTITAPGASGPGILTFVFQGEAVKFDRSEAEETMTSYAWITSPFEIITTPGTHQGSSPVICGAAIGDFACSVAFEFGKPFNLHWRARSVVFYRYLRVNNASPAPLLGGAVISASTNVNILAIGQYDPASGWTMWDNATVNIAAAVPEPGAAALAGTGLAALLLGNHYLDRIRGKVRPPVR